jgi:hypothetical protein
MSDRSAWPRFSSRAAAEAETVRHVRAAGAAATDAAVGGGEAAGLTTVHSPNAGLQPDLGRCHAWKIR